MLEQTDWLATELAESVSSPEAFPAKTSASQDNEPACPVSAAACGPSFFEYSLKLDPVGLSLRMSLGCALSEAIKCSLTWQEQVTPLGRWWWVLSMPERRTDGNGFGLLPTICSADCDPAKGERGELSAFFRGTKGYQRRLLPTAKASDGRTKGNGGNRKSPGLDQMAKAGMLPTPTARDWKSTRASQATHNRNSRPPSEAIGMQDGTGTRRLSPCFVEWLMGYPAGWTDVSD